LKRRDELLPALKKWSLDYLLHKNAAPMFFENEWGLAKPDDVTQNNYDVHSPARALGFQRLALAAGAGCHVSFPEHPAYDRASKVGAFVCSRIRENSGRSQGNLAKGRRTEKSGTEKCRPAQLLIFLS
jgi:hypothetical protein